MKKVVLITGGSKGIGVATAEKFVQENDQVIINYAHDDEVAHKVKEKLESLYKTSIYLIKGDVSDSEFIKQMVEQIIQQFGHIDILVNNAAIALDQLIEDKTEVEFKRVLDVNLIGPFLLSKEVGNKMYQQGYGKIINVSSTNGIDTYYPESIDYDASKAGLISLTKNFANVYAPFVQVNTVAPGWVNTEMNKELSEEFIKKEEGKILLNRFAEPSEIASVIYFLTTKEASYINGTVIRIDGGVKV